jgi:hypothetical protein
MNWTRKSRWSGLAVGVGAAVGLAGVALFGVRAAVAAGKGLDVEIAYEAKALKITGVVSPRYVQVDNGKLVFSDASGGVFSAPISGGKATQLAKVADPGGLAIAPAGFGSYAGQIFVLSQTGDKAPCEVMRIDKGSASSFAKLPDSGKINGGKATDCRDLEFGTGQFAGKLFAVTNGNATVYQIDSGGKAKAFAVFDQPPTFELSSLSFTDASDTKAPNSMLIGMRPRTEVSLKVGRIIAFGPDGKQKTEYKIGFGALPTGWGYAPGGFGNYGGQLFILDAGRPADKNSGARDGNLYRVDNKGVVRPFASGMVDPNCLRIVGKTMVIADPSQSGTPGKGAIVVISSML